LRSIDEINCFVSFGHLVQIVSIFYLSIHLIGSRSNRLMLRTKLLTFNSLFNRKCFIFQVLRLSILQFNRLYPLFLPASLLQKLQSHLVPFFFRGHILIVSRLGHIVLILLIYLFGLFLLRFRLRLLLFLLRLLIPLLLVLCISPRILCPRKPLVHQL
jgi:hypothetical protein